MNLRIIDGGLIHTYSTLANCVRSVTHGCTGGLLTRYPTIDCMVDIGSTFIHSFIHSFIHLFIATNVKTYSPLHMTKTYYDYVIR